MQQCHDMEMEELPTRQGFQKDCVEDGKGNYSEEEVVKLKKLDSDGVSIQCFLRLAQDRCQGFVASKIYEALASTLVPLAR